MKRYVEVFLLMLSIGIIWLLVVAIFQEISHASYQAALNEEKRQSSMLFAEIKEPEYIPEPEPIQVVASLPKTEEPHEEVNPWLIIRDNIAYMLQGYPLEEYADVIAKACWESGMDYYWFCTISIHESSGGTYCFRDYNAWGWKAGDWSSWEESIDAYCHAFVSIYGQGLNESNHYTYDPGGSYAKYF